MGVLCRTASLGKLCQGAAPRPGAGSAGPHTIAKLLVELPIDVDSLMIEKGRVLDNLYVPTRYANGHPEGAPFEHYGPLQSDEAIRYAGEIIEFVRTRLA